MTEGRFRTWLAGTALVAVVLRVAVIAGRPPCEAGSTDVANCFTGNNDAFYYHAQGEQFAAGNWFALPNPTDLWSRFGETRPTAFHPPLYSTFLGILDVLGVDTITGQRVASAVLLGGASVVLIGLVGRRMAGDRAGLLAAGAAALYPALWINDTVLMAESLYAVMLATVVLVAYRLWDEPTARWAGTLGLVIAVTTLTRAEALLLLPLVAWPVLWAARGLTPRRRLQLAGLSLAGTLVLLVPWSAFNTARMTHPVLLTTSLGTALNLSNCDDTYFGDTALGYLSDCNDIRFGPDLDETEQERLLRRRALDHVEANVGRTPVVALARAGRMLGVYRPTVQIRADWAAENRGRWPSVAPMLAWYALLPLAVGGLVALARRPVPISPMVGPIVVALVAAVGVQGYTRFRVAIDVVAVVLAAVAVELLLRRYRPQSSPMAARSPTE